MDDDPRDYRMPLAFSLRNNRGKYALLLGSGVSTEAGMPTGWDVVEDLITQMVSSEDDNVGDYDRPAEWYRDKYEEDPSYERVIQRLGISQDDRKSLLEDYFEPTDEERERDDKTPTEAHHSIAWLVDEGYINVILTTNFDQLLEDALRERGVRPVVVTGGQSAAGAEPLDHQDAIVVKVNGDYTETTIKNLSSELEEYSDPMQTIIDRTFRDYGLLICGWSGKHDTRLRESLLATETHRYSTYWTYYSGLNDEASRIVSHRDGVAFQTDGASSFFTDLEERLRGLEGTPSGDPISTDVARERVKRYLPREKHKIALADFVRETAKETRERVHDESRFPLASDEVADGIQYGDRPMEYNPATRTLLAEVITIGHWGGESANTGVRPVIDAISTVSPNTGPEKTPYIDYLLQCRRYPAILLIYGAGVGAVSSGNWELIDHLFTNEFRTYTVQTRNGKTGTSMELFHPWILAEMAGNGSTRETVDSSIRGAVKTGVEDVGMEFFSSTTDFEESFKTFEVIFDLALLKKVGEDRVRFIEPTYWEDTVDSVGEVIRGQGNDWPLVQNGVIADDVDEVEVLCESLKEELF